MPYQHIRNLLSIVRAPCFSPCVGNRRDGYAPEMHYFWTWDEEQVIRAAEADMAKWEEAGDEVPVTEV